MPTLEVGYVVGSMRPDVVADRYRLVEQCSATAMAEVFVAEDLVLDRRVAVKLLGSDADPTRFEREARAAAGLAHPNIVQVFDYGRQDDRPYMVLEYLEGGTLEDRLVPGEALRDDVTRRIARDVAAGLAHAHERGVVHRDLKPGNVLFDAEDRAKVGDFGIARVVGADTLTAAGTILGTAAYISPEQVAGTPATPASDVYSFGVLLYRMVTGRLPFESAQPLELAQMHQTQQPPPVQSFRRDAPRDLAALAMAALAKAPEARPADGGALVAALGESPAPAAALDGAPTAVLRRPPRRATAARIAIPLVALLLVAVGVVVAVLVAGPHASAPAGRLDSRAGATGTRARSSSSAATTTAAPQSTATTATQATRPRTVTSRSKAPPTTTARTPSTAPSAPPPSSPTTIGTTTAEQTSSTESTATVTTTP